ncbi:MAG: YbjQ family protein [Coriobacteriaceae bacterium]|nr:YbjQ family protein [Coriobacteriaceae bacterium]
MLTITTTNNLDGYEVVEYLGIVTGEAVSGINMFRDIGAGFRNVFGGRSAGYEDEMQQAREEVLSEMSARAESMGANAVIGVSVGYETFAEMIMTCATGTAVRVRRKA